ncbi:MAG: hypothetical protein AB1Z98_20325 [Nannocystaceae bacterium]
MSCYALAPRVHFIEQFEVVGARGLDSIRLRHRDRGFETTVPGLVLEAQLERPGSPARFVLLLTDDSPFEETLHMVLLGEDGRVLEHQQLDQPYTSGLLQDLHIEAPDMLRFRFFGDYTHHLQIHSRPRGLRRRWLQLQSSHRGPP